MSCDDLPNTNSLRLSFDIIEKSLDGVAVQIIYTGDPNAKIFVKGVVEGAKEPNSIGLNLCWSRHQLVPG